MENLKTLESQLQGIRSEVRKFIKEQELEIKELETEKYWPLINQANVVKKEIDTIVKEKYKGDLSLLYTKEEELERAIDLLKIKEAGQLWHPEGTIVTLWERRNSWSSNSEYRKTDKTGIVKIYDGTQDTPSNIRYYSLPKKGDVVVFHNKKDGTMGLKFDEITSYGSLKPYFPMWLAEGETPTNNFKTRKQAKIVSEETV